MFSLRPRRVGQFFSDARRLDMMFSYQYWVDVVKYFYNSSKTRLSWTFQSYFINGFYEVTLKRPRQSGFQKIVKLFDYINSVLIRKHHIKTAGVLKKMTHPTAYTSTRLAQVTSNSVSYFLWQNTFPHTFFNNFLLDNILYSRKMGKFLKIYWKLMKICVFEVMEIFHPKKTHFDGTSVAWKNIKE